MDPGSHHNPLSLHSHGRQSGRPAEGGKYDDRTNGPERTRVPVSRFGLLYCAVGGPVPFPNSIGDQLRRDGSAARSHRSLRGVVVYRATTEHGDRITVGRGCTTRRGAGVGSETRNGVGGHRSGPGTGHFGVPFTLHRNFTVRRTSARPINICRGVAIVVAGGAGGEYCAGLPRGAG